MPREKKVEATNVASPRVSGWAIVVTAHGTQKPKPIY